MSSELVEHCLPSSDESNEANDDQMRERKKAQVNGESKVRVSPSEEIKLTATNLPQQTTWSHFCVLFLF
jgi:hypothetical protein